MSSEPKPIGIERLCQWAFGTEKARLDPEDEHLTWARGRTVDTVWLMMRRAELGCKVDGGGAGLFGGPDVHPEADAVAAVCKGVLDHRASVLVAHHGLAGTRPSWMPESAPHVEPAAWTENQHGRRAATEPAISSPKYPGGTWRDWMRKPTVRRAMQIGLELTEADVEHILYVGRVTPIRIEPTLQQINAHRIEYLNWWSALHVLRESLRDADILKVHRLTSEMPPDMPWRKAGETSEGLPEHRKGTSSPW